MSCSKIRTRQTLAGNQEAQVAPVALEALVSLSIQPPGAGRNLSGTCTGGSPSPWGRGMKINGTGGNVEMNHVSNVTNNTDSGNNFTNSTVNKNNSSTVNNNINRSGDTVTNDYSVKMGEGVNFSGASGVNFWSNNGNNTGRSSM